IHFSFPSHIEKQGVIRINKDDTRSSGKVIIEFAFSFSNSFQAAKSFQMSLPNIRDQSVTRLSKTAKKFNFFLMIGAHFNYRNFAIRSDSQQGKRYTDMVVQVTLSSINPETLSEYRAYKFFGSGFSITAGNAYNRDSELLPVICCQLLKAY